MLTHYNPVDITRAIDLQLHPTITMWNRLEGRPRTFQFDKALKAEVRDALWMLCKQWQMGEFKGEDAGSVVFSKIKINTSTLSNFTLGNAAAQDIHYKVPLETLIEQKKIPMLRGGARIALDIRLQLGKYWQMLLKREGFNSYIQAYIQAFPFILPTRDRDNDHIYGHKDELQHWMAISGRCMDGYELLSALKAGSDATANITLQDVAHKIQIDNLADAFITYYEQSYMQPADTKEQAWLPDRLEYKASLSSNANGIKDIFSADEYYQGHLDWYSFNLKSMQTNVVASEQTFLDTFIPTHVEFEGMPEKRWWKFEDAKTSFGNIAPNTTELSKLMLIQFGLSFANDWFLVPFVLPIGSIADVRGIAVHNNFGDTYWIEATEKEEETAIKNWSVFKQTSAPNSKKLFLCPSAIKVQEGESLEDLWLIRDEQANMVWGIEKVIPSARGVAVQGAEYAMQKRKYHESFINNQLVPIPYAANAYYNAMTTVPENWIPFIPVHAEGHKRQIQLQRASMPRIIEGDPNPPKKIKPMGSILREGLDNIPKPLAYYLHEEEVTRSGTRIVQNYQRTRWIDGSVFVWMASKKKTGRGEGNSGLLFDQLAATKRD